MEYHDFDTKEYKTSRVAYIFYCAFDYFVGILISGSFLAKLLSHIGLSDSEIGIVSSFLSFAFLFQLMSIMFAGKIRNTKLASLIFMAVAQLLFMTLFLIPSFGLSRSVGSSMSKIIILLAYLAQYFISVFIGKWANSYVHPDNRGKFSAAKELISLIGGMLFTMFVSFGFDWFEKEKSIEHGFIFFAIMIFICSVLTFVSLMFIKSDKSELAEEKSVSVKETILHMSGNKKFLRVMLVVTLFKCATYMTAGFLGIYQIKELGFALGTISIMSTVATVSRMLVTMPFGRFSDKTSFTNGMFVGFIILSCAYLVMIFTSPAARWLMAIYLVLSAVSSAGTGQNSYNIMYKCVEQKYFVQANAITNVISGLLGFVASLAGGYVLGKVGSDGCMVLGFKMYGQQILAGISFAIALVTTAITYFAILRPENKEKKLSLKE